MEEQRKDAEWFQPDRVMSKEEEKAAYEGQIQYPQVVKKRVDPPIDGQIYCCLSFITLPEPVKGVHAFVKCRGAWPSKEVARDHGKKIVRDVDSKFQIKIPRVGTWVPVTNSEKYDEEDIIIREDISTGKLQDDPIKAAEEKHDKIIKELREKEKKLRDKNAADDPYSDKTGIEYYTMRTVTILNIQKYIKEGEEKVKELKSKEKEMQDEIEYLNKKFPSHKKEWLETYNARRKDVGMNPYDPKNGHNFAC